MTTITTPHSSAKQPHGVFIMFFLQMSSMVGFSFIFSLLVLYSTKKLGMTDTHAYALSSAYNALVFAISVFGGYIAERFLGYRYAVIASGLFAIIGMSILAIPSLSAMYWGLGFFVIATGTMVPSLFVLLGRLYKNNDPLRDGGFTIAYVGLNIGSFFASITSGYLSDISYAVPFIAGAIFYLITLIAFLNYKTVFSKKHSDDTPTSKKIRSRAMFQSRPTGLFLLLISVPLIAALLNFSELTNILLIVTGIGSAFLIIYLAMKETAVYRKKMIAFLILIIVSVAFWALYMLSPSALIIFIERNVDRHVMGYTIPTATYSALNPFFIVTSGTLLSLLWMKLNQKGKGISTPTKFALGVFLMGFGFIILGIGIHCTHNSQGHVSSWWVVLSYFFQTGGELFVAPIGLAMVGELVPARLEGLMMGILQVANGLGGAVSDYLANITATPQASAPATLTNPIYFHAFMMFGLVTAGVALLTAVFVPYLKRIGSYNK